MFQPGPKKIHYVFPTLPPPKQFGTPSFFGGKTEKHIRVQTKKLDAWEIWDRHSKLATQRKPKVI